MDFLGCIYTAGLDAQFRFVDSIKNCWLLKVTHIQYLHLCYTLGETTAKKN